MTAKSPLPAIAENQMKTTYKSLLLASTVLEFDIIELWSDEGDGLNCTYVYVDQDFTIENPTICSAPYPSRKCVSQSQFLCALAKESGEDRCFWITGDVPKDNLGEDYRKEVNREIPFQSQFGYLLKKVDEEGGSSEVFIVGYSLDRVECKPGFLKFLSGLSYAIYVAAYDIDENVVENVANIETTISDFAVKGRDYNYHFDDSTHSKYSLSSSIHSEAYADAFKNSTTARGNMEQHPREKSAKIGEATPTTVAISPTFDSPAYLYDYHQIKPKIDLKLNLALHHFKNVKHIADGTNANIYTANLYDDNGDFVVIKMLKGDCAEDEMAIHELDVELGLLSRMDHPNIIKVVGGGSVPRKFIVMEHLGGGSLHSVMAANPERPGLLAKFTRKPTWQFDDFLVLARDLALALDYLHFKCQFDACILHRDLKPENIGVTKDGKLKLFDFGLSSCVKKFSAPTDTYEMTGYTGSLRYMAPEVVEEKPYNEKVDVYSYAIVLWQMAKDRVPFKGLNKDQFTQQVVGQNFRPKLSKKWPPAFCALLAQCWDADPLKRPSLAHCAAEIKKIIESRRR